MNRSISLFLVNLLILAFTPLAVAQSGQPFEGRRPSAQQQAVFDQYGTALRYLIEAHPSPEISVNLNRLISEGTVYLTYESLAETNAYGANAVASFTLASLAGEQRVVPVLVIDPGALLDPQTEFKMLVIYHEYQHYRQWSSGRYPERLFMAWSEDDLMTEAEATAFYQSEVAAYEAECALADSIGWNHVFQLCEVLSDPVTFRISVARSLMADPKMKWWEAQIMRLARLGR